MSAFDERDDNIRMIRESAAAVAEPGNLRRVRGLRFQEPGFERAVWRTMAEMGWIGLRVPERAGGSGLGVAELCALAEALGAGLVPEPLIFAAPAARLLGGAALEAALAGERIVIPAWQERAAGLDFTGEARFDRGRATGRKIFIPMAGGADAFLVTTREGPVLVPRDGAGAALKLDQTQDGGHYGTLDLASVSGEAVPDDFGDVFEETTLAVAAYLLGVMDRAFAITLDYLKTRVQFGRPIGSFQALQHRAADLKIQIALTRASVGSAAAVLDGSAPNTARRAAVSRAKARASDAAMLVTRQAIQLHGGIGYADEHDIGLFLRKAMVLSNLHGAAAAHRARYAASAPESDE